MSSFRIYQRVPNVLVAYPTTDQKTEGSSDQVIGRVLLGNSSQNDAFGRLRVSDPVTLFDSSMEVDEQPLLWNTSTQNGGSSTYNTNQSSVTLSTTANTASSQAIRQSIQYSRYQPGKSLLIFMTFVMGSVDTGNTKRVGYFDVQNGVFLQQNGSGVISWGIRSYITGTAVDTIISQSSWNVDTMDGTGPSGLTLDITKSLILIIDLEWLGVGRVRVGFVINGIVYYCHFFDHNSETTAYMSRASLTTRYEITSDSSGSNAAGSLVQICSSVISEGGYVPRGIVRAIGTSSAITVASGVFSPVIAIRLKSAYIKASIIPIEVEVQSATNDAIEILGIMRPTITGGTWNSASTATEYNQTMSSYSDGYIVHDSYTDSRGSFSIPDFENNNMVIGANITATTSDVFLVAIRSNSGTSADVFASIRWKEIY